MEDILTQMSKKVKSVLSERSAYLKWASSSTIANTIAAITTAGIIIMGIIIKTASDPWGAIYKNCCDHLG